MGQAFFTLSIGMGAIMAYGAYMPRKANIGQTILVVAFFDSMVDYFWSDYFLNCFLHSE